MLTRGDSGRPVRALRAPAAGKGAALSRVAAMICGNAKFQRLDHNARAATLFHEAVRKPFLKWSGLYA